uniref:non-specific protein-tyrosine kinase n=1 Tax=Hartaetosiga gracilis TaxID=216892 RepID=B3XVX9_9EUKA|nr:protein tyrosine kinase tec [Hartaetosiga gracilis]|eukprot:m.13362 g.13362  ORF g.13362 m.13362 type:complete len:643 (+) comp7506_c0_seq1:88-2016(+)
MMDDPNAVLLDGLMLKRAQGKSTFGKMTWKDRMFELKSDSLHYYLPDKSKEKGTIDLSDVLAVEAVDLRAFKRPFMFQVVRPDYILYCQCSSQLDLKRWLEALRRRIAGNPNRSTHFHTCHFDGRWKCCRTPKETSGCTPCFDYSGLDNFIEPQIDTSTAPVADTQTTTAKAEPRAEEEAPPRPPKSAAPPEVVLFEVTALFNYNATNPDDLDLKQGETLEVLSTEEEFWWRARNSAGKVGMIPSNYVAKPGFESEPWYVGKMSRVEAQSKLQIFNLDGTFLVRESETSAGSYTLSVYFNGQPRNYRIQHDGNEYYITTRHRQKTIKELIDYHKLNGGGLCTRLKKPACDDEAPTPHDLGSDKWEIDPSEISLGKVLGSGQFGVVYKGKFQGVTDVAVKKVKGGAMAEDEFIAEAEIMKQFKHKNLVNLYGVVTKKRPLMIVTEFMRNGCLLNYLRDHNSELQGRAPVLLYMSIQVANAMVFLEEHGFIHRDLAARNCLVGEHYAVKVTDFGLSRYTLDDEYTASEGTKFPIKWSAPEVFEFGRFSSKSDVWSFGVLLWEIWSIGIQPYPDKTNAQTVEFLDKGGRLNCPYGCPDHIFDIMKECWHKDIELRPPFADLYYKLEENKALYDQEVFEDVEGNNQ